MLLQSDVDRMAYFDVVASDDAAQISKELGYKKIFLIGSDVLIADAKEAEGEMGKKVIVSGGPVGILMHVMGKNNVIGLLVSGNEANKQLLANMAENGKLIIFSASNLTCTDQRTRLRNLGLYKQLLKTAKHVKVPLAIATVAQDRTGALSPAQLIEIAKFIGADHETAKAMLSELGVYLDTKE